MISCIILAAGLSSRFGSPKALAQINGCNALHIIQHKALSTNCDEIIIVSGSHSDLVSTYVLNHKRIQIVYNKDYLLGQTSSFQVGLQHASSDSTAFIVWPVDCPFIQAKTINALITSYQKHNSTITIPIHNNKRGHPPLFSSRIKDELLHLPVSKGINSLYRSNHHNIYNLETADTGIHITFNTPEELLDICSKHKDML